MSEYEENPDTTVWWIAGGAVAVGALWLLMRKKPAAAAAVTPSRTPTARMPPAPPKAQTPGQEASPEGQTTPVFTPVGSCAVDQASLNIWGFAQGRAAFYLPTLTAPITFADLKKQFPVTSLATPPLLFVTQNGVFYSFDSQGNPVHEPSLQDSYCKSKTFQFVPVNFSPGPVPRKGE